jgi:hypothetical protein
MLREIPGALSARNYQRGFKDVDPSGELYLMYRLLSVDSHAGRETIEGHAVETGDDGPERLRIMKPSPSTSGYAPRPANSRIEPHLVGRGTGRADRQQAAQGRVGQGQRSCATALKACSIVVEWKREPGAHPPRVTQR